MRKTVKKTKKSSGLSPKHKRAISLAMKRSWVKKRKQSPKRKSRR